MENLQAAIREKAKELGFAKIGISRAEPLDERNGLEAWRAAGRHGEMLWMGRNAGKRLDPRALLSEARSVISLAANYYTPQAHSEDPRHGKISRYAWGRDYHQVLKERMKSLAEWIGQAQPEACGLYYCDTGPVMDKAWAHKSGLGWIGKHSNLITRDLGSWVFLGEIVLNLELDEDAEGRNYCGTCHRCIDVCPTRAIVAPYVVDARLCISYLTIELRGPIPRELRPLIGSRIFGCDDCQDVCPWNRFATPCQDGDFYPDRGNHVPVLIDLMRMTQPEFEERFRRSPVRRAKYAGFLRNVAVALGNSRDAGACEVLAKSLGHRESLVRQHAAWALGEIGGDLARQALRCALPGESQPAVAEEIREALRKSERKALSASSSNPAFSRLKPFSG
ncbi:MAG: tRNA epoxyqueuosine(34) reductase QueG [Acidobacteria bacterium]|nr:tRNA epoxyqueuosine(34) reductase QueG [Acidobacteriota bacterium]